MGYPDYGISGLRDIRITGYPFYGIGIRFTGYPDYGISELRDMVSVKKSFKCSKQPFLMFFQVTIMNYRYTKFG
jgi:hypothetical protein